MDARSSAAVAARAGAAGAAAFGPMEGSISKKLMMRGDNVAE
jgi:hypothetical protein